MFSTKEIQLTLEQCTVLQRFTEDFVAELDVHRDILTDTLITRLKTYVYCGPEQEVVTSNPLDWKEAVKERFAPSWLLRKYPVKYKTYIWKLSEVFPDIRVDKTKPRNLKVVYSTKCK